MAAQMIIMKYTCKFSLTMSQRSKNVPINSSISKYVVIIEIFTTKVFRYICTYIVLLIPRFKLQRENRRDIISR